MMECDQKPHKAGVYVWFTINETMQYVVSTRSQYAWYMSHAEDFINRTEKKQHKIYQWRKGKRSWQEVIRSYNYFKEFVQSYPHYTLSLLELQRLKLRTELISRLKRHPFYWNIQKTVQFYFIGKISDLTPTK
jgi:hypothetical protein